MFKERLKEARKNAGLSQEKLGAMLGISKQTVSDYERGYSEPDMNKIMQIMKLLNVEANFLWQDEMAEPSVKKETLSKEAQAFAAKFDSLSEYGKEMIRCIFQNDKQYKIMKRVQMLGTAYVDGRIETKLASIKEVREIESDLKEAVQVFE